MPKKIKSCDNIFELIFAKNNCLDSLLEVNQNIMMSEMMDFNETKTPKREIIQFSSQNNFKAPNNRNMNFILNGNFSFVPVNSIQFPSSNQNLTIKLVRSNELGKIQSHLFDIFTSFFQNLPKQISFQFCDKENLKNKEIFGETVLKKNHFRSLKSSENDLSLNQIYRIKVNISNPLLFLNKLNSRKISNLSELLNYRIPNHKSLIYNSKHFILQDLRSNKKYSHKKLKGNKSKEYEYDNHMKYLDESMDTSLMKSDDLKFEQSVAINSSYLSYEVQLQKMKKEKDDLMLKVIEIETSAESDISELKTIIENLKNQ
ncbi:unnamed protein product, partial [Brachionus calyciflorus]